MELELCTVTDVKAQLEWTSAADDAVILDLVKQVSEEAEQIMGGRHTLVAARTETYKLKPNRPYISLRGAPVTTVASVKYSRIRDFTDVDALETDTYEVISEIGQIRLLAGAIGAQFNPGFVQVTYTGGMALTTAAFKAAFARLEGAVRTEVINRFNRRKNPEGNLQMMGTSVGYQGAMKPLADFETALGHRQRLRL